ncbi:hypothetical protein HQ545_08140 [Candidatus Woesearchaeota archaeon]|nr:hypothetical protein [Candidatus Woesearchaeota archaeon]
MKIEGLPEEINEHLEQLPKIKEYYTALAANSSYVKTGEADYLLDDVSDSRLRTALVYIGKHNRLPRWSNLKSLTNDNCATAYRRAMIYGWANLQTLMWTVRGEFMSPIPPDQIKTAKQVALVCKTCGEYKATGMFGTVAEKRVFA